MRVEPEAFRSVVEQLPDAVSIFCSVRDAGGDIVDFEWVYTNPAHEGATGHSAEDLIGRALSEVFPTLVPSALFEGYKRVADRGEPYVDPVVWIEDTWGTGARERRAFDVRAVKVEDGVVVVSRDVTEDRQRAEADRLALHEASESLARADEVKSTFLRTVSHDVRSPLTAILSAARLLDGGIPLSDEERRDFAMMIVRNSNRIKTLLDDVLDVERIAAGEALEPQPEAVDLAGVIETLRADLLNATDHTIEVAADVHTIWADRTFLERILRNLLGNAVKYTPKGGTIFVRTWHEEDGTIVAVEDRGIGVPDAAKTLIFEPFRRAADVHVPGSGIGLSLVASFARAHGGRAWVEDLPERGSSFRVYFPDA
jgi:PAS domain S-box-containing protein